MALRCFAGLVREHVRRSRALFTSSHCPNVTLLALERRTNTTIHLTWRSTSTNKQRDSQSSAFSSMVSFYMKLSDGFRHWLVRTYPTAGKVYVQFINGAVHSWNDGKTAMSIMRHKRTLGRNYAVLTWREVEKCRQFKLDVLKTSPVFLLAMIPVVYLLVLPLIYVYPKQLLSAQFWSQGQKVAFFSGYHMGRAAYYSSIVQELERKLYRVDDNRDKTKLHELCLCTLKGDSPSTAAILRVRPTFMHPALHLRNLSRAQLSFLSRVLLLNPYLPKALLKRRLQKHLEDIHAMDHGIQMEGVGKLTTEELRKMCYLRGVNSTSWYRPTCEEWLSRWVMVSTQLEASELCLLAHCMVFLSTGHSRVK